ncbi:MAG: GDSL-type esterase/lipase family protein [Treponema sp.]|jgi:lysophospholipase L1-like esterase|nr:GDSL-type esterase/lipase family protein [Treponema sp.]
MPVRLKGLLVMLCVFTVVGHQVFGRPIRENGRAEPVKIFLAGDSTVCDFVTDGAYQVKRAGWGRYLQSWFIPGTAAVFNYAMSGRSSKSFTTEAAYRRVLNEIGAGDYLFIQFGHNDEKIEDSARGTDVSGSKETEGSFKWYLYEKYVVPARQKGAEAVLVTPVSRREESGGVSDSHKNYDDAVRELAEEAGVPLIDLTQKTAELYERILSEGGAEGTAALFAVRKDDVPDNTHFNGEGAQAVCALLIAGIKELKLPLVNLITNNETAAAARGNAENSPGTSLIAFNAAIPMGALGSAYRISGFGQASKEAWLLYPRRIDLLTDTVKVEAKMHFKTLEGHNGIGFVSVDGMGRKGYMMISGQNAKNVGTTGGAGGQSLNAASGFFVWETGKDYIFKSEIAGGIINHYVYDVDGTLLASKTDTEVNRGHSNTDIVYAAAGGTDTGEAVWSDIKIVYNNAEYIIDSISQQKDLPVFSVTPKMIRLRRGDTAELDYIAAAAGGKPASLVAVSDAPDILKIEKKGREKITVKGIASGTTTLRFANAAEPSLKAEVTVTVLDFPRTADYGHPALYPAAGTADAYPDGEFCITFENTPELLKGGTIWIYDGQNGRPVDTIAFENERQKVLGAADNDIFVGDQLVRIQGNSVYFTPHFDALEYGRRYYIAIPGDSIKAELNGRSFDGLPDRKNAAFWTFNTRPVPVPEESKPITVNGNGGADFRTVYGAMKALALKSGSWTINVAPGVYNELVHYDGQADIALVGQGTAPFGGDVIIQYTNCNQMNGGTNTRPGFYFSGANLTLKNLTLKNTSRRGISYTGGAVPSDTQAEALNFANGGGKTLAAINCSFLSFQDTLQTTGRNWFYRCYVEGDTDFIWGTADVCLLEDCDIVCLNDPNREAKETYLMVSRTGQARSETVPKGYVIFNSRVKVADGMTLYFGRNAGGSGFYDQCAVVNTQITLEGKARMGSAIWRTSPYIFIPGAAEHVGWKIFGCTLNGLPLGSDARLPNTAVLNPQLAESEYGSRELILNRVYHKDGAYQNVPSAWNP